VESDPNIAAAAIADAPDLVARNLKRNVFSIVLFEFTWGLGMMFVIYNPMVPAYLTMLAAPKTLMGFMQALWAIATPVQLLSDRWFGGPRRVRNAMMIYMAAVGIRLVFDIAAVALGGRWTGPGVLWGFVLACAGFVALIVVAQPIYIGVLTDNLPRDQRGRLFGLRTLGLGVGGILTGAAASWVLRHWPSPMNYRVSFLAGDALLLVSCLSLLPFRDRPDLAKTPRSPSLLADLRAKLRTLLDNPNYRVFLFFHVLNVSAVSIAAFIVPFAKERLAIADDRVAVFSLVFLATNAIMGIVIGRIADRFGYRVVGIVQSVSLIVLFLLAVAARDFAVVSVAYVLYSVCAMSTLMVLSNMSVELCPDLSAIDLTALGTTIILPAVATVPPLAGAILDLTGSYVSVFFVGASFAVIGLMGFLLLVREPRSGRIYVVKQIPMR